MTVTLGEHRDSLGWVRQVECLPAAGNPTVVRRGARNPLTFPVPDVPREIRFKGHFDGASSDFGV